MCSNRRRSTVSWAEVIQNTPDGQIITEERSQGTQDAMDADMVRFFRRFRRPRRCLDAVSCGHTNCIPLPVPLAATPEPRANTEAQAGARQVRPPPTFFLLVYSTSIPSNTCALATDCALQVRRSGGAAHLHVRGRPARARYALRALFFAPIRSDRSLTPNTRRC